jgi:hypothetical protein
MQISRRWQESCLIVLGRSLVVLLLFGALPIVEASPVERNEMLSRQLNGNNFVRSELVAWPFPSTYFGLSFGAGTYGFEIADGLDTEGNPLSLKIGAAALASGLDLGIGFRDWIGLQAGLSGFVTAATDLESAINFGALAEGLLWARVVGRLYRGHRLLLALALSGEYSRGMLLNPRLAFGNLLASDTFTPETLLTAVKMRSLAAEAAAAFAPMAILGLQSSISVQLGSSELGDSPPLAGIALHWGFGVAADFAPYVPIALPLAYRLSAAFDLEGAEEAEVDHFVEAGLVYSGRSDLELGVFFSTQLSRDRKLYVGVLRMCYYW